VKTDQLIEMLSRADEPAPKPRGALRLALTLAAGLVAGVALLVIGVGVRPDIGVAMMPVLMKAGFAALVAVIVLPLTIQLMKPGRPMGWRLAAIAVFLLLCCGAAAIALMGEMPENRMQAWTGGAFPWCLVLIPLLATPTAALLVWTLRAFAPTRLTLMGAAVGGLSGGVGAMAYAMYCPVDSVAFVVTWYSLGIAIAAALGALIGPRLLRW
jgi:hypothetical protein